MLNCKCGAATNNEDHSWEKKSLEHNEGIHMSMVRTHTPTHTYSRQTVVGLHWTGCSLGTLHSTESCLHPYIPTQTGGVQRGLHQTEGWKNIWVQFFSLMVQWVRFVAVVRLQAPWSPLQTFRPRHVHIKASHARGIARSGQPTVNRWPRSGSRADTLLKPSNTVRRGRRERTDRIEKT